ncbi:MAG: class I SAM-dependent methyltransferase [Opitutae bacterium]|nr:class I SAM-dependent methyltransferase [Opitutae bacterium]
MKFEDIAGEACPFCSRPGPSLKYRFEDCAILRCHGCGLMWLHPRPGLEQLHKVYDEGYYQNKEFFQKDGNKLYGYVDYLAERINKQYDYQRVVGRVKGMLPERGGGPDGKPRWLDVGCGLGFLMDVAFDQGFQVQGVEFNRSAIRYIQSKFTYPVEYGLVQELKFDGTFDVISLFDVIEHMNDPADSLRFLRGIVAPGGVCAIQTMDSDSFMSRLIGKRLEDFRRTREHLYFFSRRSITRMLNETGWEVVDIRFVGHTFQIGDLIKRISVYGGWIEKLAKALVHPRWLLEANIYFNPGVKMMVYARPK